jgi:hypothetical protein
MFPLCSPCETVVILVMGMIVTALTRMTFEVSQATGRQTMILLDRTDVHAMCPLCNAVIFTNGEIRDGCEQRAGCMLRSQSTIEHARVYVFRLMTGQTVAVDLEDKTKIIGIAWRMDKSGHIIGTINGKTILLHRLVTGTFDPAILIDHRHHDTCDNRKSQLRDATVTTNRRNTRKSKGNSQFLGVYYDAKRDRFAASIQYNDPGTKRRRNRHLGYFPPTPEGEWEAAQAYNARAKEDYGEFAVLNVRQPFVHRGAEVAGDEET